MYATTSSWPASFREIATSKGAFLLMWRKTTSCHLLRSSSTLWLEPLISTSRKIRSAKTQKAAMFTFAIFGLRKTRSKSSWSTLMPICTSRARRVCSRATKLGVRFQRKRAICSLGTIARRTFAVRHTSMAWNVGLYRRRPLRTLACWRCSATSSRPTTSRLPALLRKRRLLVVILSNAGYSPPISTRMVRVAAITKS